MWRVLAVLSVLALSSCSCRKKETLDAGAALRSRPRASWPSYEVPERPTDLFGVQAWSTVFALLFERRGVVSAPACAMADAGCRGLTPMELHREPMVSQDLVLGGDGPQAFIGEQVTFIEAREARILAAVASAKQIEAARHPVAAVLLQNDLLERIDAIDEAIRSEPDVDWAALRRIREALDGLVRHLALPEAVVKALPTNEARVERSFPEVLAGFGTRTGWGEVVSHFTDHRLEGATWHHGTRHAERHGQRMVFRVFVRAPPELLKSIVAEHPFTLPAGARLVLTGAPLHSSREGHWVRAPFITLLETRVAQAEGFIPGPIGTLESDIFEGRREVLVRALESTGGLERLPKDALIPIGATCMPDLTARVPAAATCVTCHGPRGAMVTGPMSHGDMRLELTTDEDAASRFASEARRARPSLQ